MATGPAGARDSRPGLIGTDDRKPIDSVAAPWNAIGKVQAAGYDWVETCTGTLIAPNAVVTAAHCLFDPRRGESIPPGKLHFLAGLRRDRWLAHGTVKCIRSPVQLEKRQAGSKSPGDDVAILILNQAISISPVALAQDARLKRDRIVSHAGYGRDRPYLLSLHAGCRVEFADGEILATDCDTQFGQSGGPVLVDEGGVMKLAGVMSGSIGGLANLAVAVERWRKLADNPSCDVNSASEP